MSDRPKASAPKTPVSAAPARKAATAGAPAAKSGTGSWLAGFITRAAAGIVYAVVFILCLVLGIVPTAIFVSVMSGLCCYEFFRMTRLDGKMANERMGIAAAVLFPLSALGDSMLLNALLFALMLAVGIWYVWSPRTRISDVAVTLMGPIYTGFMLSAIVLLRDAVPGFAGALLSVGVCASLWVSIRLPTSWVAVSASTRWFPRSLPKELGGVCRRHPGLGFDLAHPVGDALLQAQPALCAAVWRGRVHSGRYRRPYRVAHQARCGRQGFRQPYPGPRRNARS